jgi:DNA-binding GntR family transcriptional regulator
MTEFLTLKDHVYEYIAEMIREGELNQGERINENVISNKLNVSRTPVREALLQLSTEGYLDNIPRKGFVLRTLDDQEATDIYRIIGVLEGYAASTACPNLTEKDYKNMEFFVKSMNIAIEMGNYDIYYIQQNDFHNIFINKCGNNSLIGMIEMMKRKFLRKQYVVSNSESISDTLLDTNAQHWEIIKLLKAQDAIGLETYMRDVHWKPDYAYMETI